MGDDGDARIADDRGKAAAENEELIDLLSLGRVVWIKIETRQSIYKW